LLLQASYTWSCNFAWTGLELLILLSLPPK
jgi:hypothetical protein